MQNLTAFYLVIQADKIGAGRCICSCFFLIPTLPRPSPRDRNESICSPV